MTRFVGGIGTLNAIHFMDEFLVLLAPRSEIMYVDTLDVCSLFLRHYTLSSVLL